MQNKLSLSGFGFPGGSDSKEYLQQCQRPGFDPYLIFSSVYIKEKSTTLMLEREVDQADT